MYLEWLWLILPLILSMAEKRGEWFMIVLDALKMLVHGAFLSILKDVSDLFSILMMRLRN